MDLTLAGAGEQARTIREGIISARELLDAVLDRYERHNSAVNAVVVTRIEQARERAIAADEALARDEVWGPLHGVPMTVKEVFDWVGTPSTWGWPELAENRPDQNAVAVDRLLDAGAVIYGKTNVPLHLGDWQSFNDIYGVTNNPWDLSRTPGGSSGGSTAALATGMTGLELGSDIGGSIRNPAHYCGVFGHKPTYGLVPTDGHAYPGQLVPTDINVVGPLARTAADLDLALGVLSGPGKLDAAGYRVDLPGAADRSLADFRVAVMLESPCVEQDDELTERLQDAVDTMVGSGLSVDEGARPEIDQRRAHEVYVLLLGAARAATSPALPRPTLDDHVDRYHRGDRDFAAVYAKGMSLSHRDWFALSTERERYRRIWADFFTDFDLLLCPVAASTAFTHDHSGDRVDRTIAVNGRRQPAPEQLFWAGWSCGVYLPATVAPVGLAASGLPCGIQIVAPHLHDRVGIAFAELLERRLGGFQPPALIGASPS
jgi:amidase